MLRITATPGRTHAYAYNSRSELEADNIQPGGNRSYTYDNIGNRKDIVDPARNLQYASTPLNQYGAIGSFTPQYDADGNQTKIKTATGEWTVTYNANNRPVEFVQGTKRIACTYDHMGRRIEKTAWNNNTLTKRQRYIYNGYVQNAEIDATNEDAPQVVKTYLWDPSEPVATRILHMTVWNNGEETESLYYTHDLQKNVTALFGQAASRRAQYEHDPYGNPINTTGDAAGINPYRYSSEYHDEDLGLIYYNYRHYNPTDGRWINRDPIAEQGGRNLYGFVRNTPLAFMDWLGGRPLTTQEHEIVEKLVDLSNKYKVYVETNVTMEYEKRECLKTSDSIREFSEQYTEEIEKIPDNASDPIYLRVATAALGKALDPTSARNYTKEASKWEGWGDKNKCNLFVAHCLGKIKIDCKITVSELGGWYSKERIPLAGEWSNTDYLQDKFPIVQRYQGNEDGTKKTLSGITLIDGARMGDIISFGESSDLGNACHVGIYLSASLYVSATSKHDGVQKEGSGVVLKEIPRLGVQTIRRVHNK